MKHIMIGTAGHVDHGKTQLTRALTGTNTDRWAEEQRRGITIDIGFAQLTLPDGQTADLIDVPGHEKFIGNMLVGASGMDLVLLVVAADEGFMPQTREHLDILSLLGVQNGILVLTKTDLVEDEWLSAMEEECRADVKGTFLEGAPLVPVSAKTGAGLDELKAQIARLVADAAPRSDHAPFRLPIDRVFSKDGFGSVVTGTLTEGTLGVGEDVTLYPAEKKARVRALQNHGLSVQTVYCGQRVAVNLAGCDRADLRRGDLLAKSGSITLTSLVDVSLSVLKSSPYPIKNNSKLHLHYATGEEVCQCVLLGCDALRPGESGYAQLKLTAPIAARNGDRFVLRFFSPLVTVGGGVLLNLTPGKHKRSDPDVLQLLSLRGDSAQEARVEAALREGGGLLPTRADLARELSLSSDQLDEALALLTENGKAVLVGDRVTSAAAFEELWQRASALLGAYHKAEPLQKGMNRGELRGKLLPKNSAADALLDAFSAAYGLRQEGPSVALGDFSPDFSPYYAKLRDKLVALYLQFGLSPENSDDVEVSFGKDTGGCRQVVQRLVADGVLVSLSPQLRLHVSCYQSACQLLCKLYEGETQLTLGELRDGLGVSRKYALALLEYWDSAGVTRKIGDSRVLQKKPC
ncbi:MAG: selenocysteine-specific translation elongation factor [Oscillospiraceae bacterium]